MSYKKVHFPVRVSDGGLVQRGDTVYAIDRDAVCVRTLTPVAEAFAEWLDEPVAILAGGELVRVAQCYRSRENALGALRQELLREEKTLCARLATVRNGLIVPV